MESFEMWCWRRMEISWSDHVRNEEVLLRVKEHRNIRHEMSKQKAKWIGHILGRNCLLQQVIEGKLKGRIEGTGRQQRRCRKLPDDLKERRRYSCLKEEALNRTMWTARFGRGFGPFVRQTTKWMKSNDNGLLLLTKWTIVTLWTSFGILVTQQALTDSAVFKDTHISNGSFLFKFLFPSSRCSVVVPSSFTFRFFFMFLYTELLL